MARKRKTVSEKRAEREEAVALAWSYFRPKLAAIRSFKDALVLHSEAPAETAPGRKFYSNLGFFLQSFRPPAGANGEERTLYLAMLPHLEAEGLITAANRKDIESDFARAQF